MMGKIDRRDFEKAGTISFIDEVKILKEANYIIKKLATENDNLKVEIKKLKEKWSKDKKAYDKVITFGLRVSEVHDAKLGSDIIGDFLNDLSLIGKEKK